MRKGVILYGPPAAGKDTLTRALCGADARFSLFPRLKVGGGRTGGYRMITELRLKKLRNRGEIVWENCRYNAIYAVDRSELVKHAENSWPVLHLGQVEAIDAVKRSIPSIVWLVVYLWCSRREAERRIVARSTGDSLARMQAWDETKDIEADLRFDTEINDPKRIASVVQCALMHVRR